MEVRYALRMPLEDYRAKRDFATTPEPRGRVGRSRPARARLEFSVQKHLATRLHYDLRLEYDGVLLSWAVPKGPSLDPRDRRLAMQVEDHPLDYADFEGVIPEGYGAGVVLLWDRGRWKPEVPDVAEALAKGDLKFTLDGYKLKGSWVLVRTRGEGGRAWLLIKHRDDWAAAREDIDITEFAPRSVKTDGDFGDILASGDPAIWTSGRPGRGTPGSALSRVVQRALEIREQERKREQNTKKAAAKKAAGKTDREKAERRKAGTRNTGRKSLERKSPEKASKRRPARPGTPAARQRRQG